MRFLQVSAVISMTFGGPSVSVVSIGRAIGAMGNTSVTVAGSYGTFAGGPLTSDERSELLASVSNLKLLEPIRPYRLQNARGLWTTIFREVRQADFVHIHGTYMLPQFVTYVAIAVYRRRYGLQPHGNFEPYQAKKSAYRKAVYDAVVGRRLVKNAEYVLFASDTEAVRAVRVDPKKALVVPLGAFLAPPLPDPLIAELLRSAGPRGVRCLFLGRLATKKRLDLLIKSWALAARPDNARLLIAGPDEDWTVDDVRELARNAHVDSSVHVVGPVFGGYKTWLYESCGIFVLPSDNENFAISVVEAMQAGCYILVTDQVAAAAHVSRAGAGSVFLANDETLLARALEDALRADADDMRRASLAGQAYVAENLGWGKVAQAIQARVNIHMPTAASNSVNLPSATDDSV